MELVLNLIWLAVVFLLSAETYRRRAFEADPVQNGKTFVVILACIAILLFPAISLSDDLHMEYATAEGPIKNLYQILQSAGSAIIPSFIASLLLCAILAALARKSEFGIAENAFHPIDGFLPKLHDRAPPLFPIN